MRARTYQKSFSQLGNIYCQTRQGIGHLHKLHGTAILDPHELFAALVATGRKSKLRTRLSDPATRAQITAEIKAKP
jgi:hypothetical protein